MLETSTSNLKEAELSSERTSIDYNFNFFTTSTKKLVLMSICTLGFYQLYWFYMNWVAIKKAGKKCSPFWRAFFAPLFAYSCFEHIRKSMNKNNVVMSFPTGFLAASYFILRVLHRLPEPYMLISILTVLPVILANNVAIAINSAQSPNFEKNENFSIWNFLVLALGSVIFILVVIGAFFPEA